MDSKKKFHLCEVLILAPVILLIIGLFLLPTVFYALSLREPQAQPSCNSETSSCTCSASVNYSGVICRDVLTSLQMTFSDVTSLPPALNIPSTIDQQVEEEGATRLVSGLPLFSPTPQCMEAILPFLCLSLFPLCASTDCLRTILRDECLELRDNVCSDEWARAIAILGDGVLPVCENLPSNTCVRGPLITDSQSSNLTISPSTTLPITTNRSESQLTCSEGFFFDENVTNLCRPTCGEFNPIPLAATILEYASLPFCFMASLALLVLALTVQRDSLWAFPTVIFLYMSMTINILAVLATVAAFGGSAIFCGTRDLIDNFLRKEQDTLICTLSGFVGAYILEQLGLWTLLHSVFLYWAVAFPFSYRQLKTSGRIKYAHIISVAIAVIVPLPTVLQLKDGYIMPRTPTFNCIQRNRDHGYYTFTLPFSIIGALTSCLLVLTFWTILKEFVLKRLMAKGRVTNVGKAQIKIMAFVIYFLFEGVLGLVVSTENSSQREIEEFILCESSGTMECSLETSAQELLLSVTTIILFLAPVLILLLKWDQQACKKKMKQQFSSSEIKN